MIMLEEIKCDFERVRMIDGGGKRAGWCKTLWLVWWAYGFQVLVAYRLLKACRYSLQSQGPFLYLPILFFLGLSRIFYFLFSNMYGIFIHSEAVIGSGLYIGHFGGIYIGLSKIGRNCNINQQVRIGSFEAKGMYSNFVTLGDSIWIGAHSQIASGFQIGSGATISAGTIVKKNIKTLNLVGGSSCRVIKIEYDNSRLLGE